MLHILLISIAIFLEVTFAGRPLSFYLTHEKIPQVAKDLYHNTINASDNDEVLALMDSLTNAISETRPFYFLVLTKTMERADGAYAEVLGTTVKEYVERRSIEFFTYFTEETVLTDKDLDQWSEAVCREIMIIAEKNEKKEIENIKTTLRKNCMNCNTIQKKKMEGFLKKINGFFAKSK